MATRGSCVLYVLELIGGIFPIHISFMTNKTNLRFKLDGFEQNDSQGFETHTTCYEQYPLVEFPSYFFHHLPETILWL